ncbi:MAG: GNAT family N-acetyltransferase [Oscillospiraceae bacterium]|nr:GNAT family N-acetyltransferase [Oscillospiraceae bacterium]
MEKMVNDILLTTEFTQEDIEYSKKRHVEIFDGEYGFSEYFNRYATGAIDKFPQTYNPEKDFMLIAKVDGKFGGTVTLIGEGEEEGIARLRFFFVEPFTRGKGVGKLLFTTAMSMAKEMGYRHLYFSTYNVLEPARNMYRNLGYVITKETPEDEVLPGAVEEIWEIDL